jgi:oxygen-independent coproporphyrinogen-3 oxidase
VQSLNDTELKTVGRIHTAAQALEAIKLAQQAGFTRINADVITGLPGQTVASLQSTLTRLVDQGSPIFPCTASSWNRARPWKN